MKSLKKTLVLLVVLSMVLTTIVPAFAATDVAGLDCEEEVARMEALGIIKGYEDGTFGPEKTITRAEMAVIICKMVGIEEATVEGSKNVESKFSDVKAGEWYSGYINVAAGRGLLSGFPDGTFRPNETLTMNQVITLCVNALGRGEYVATMGTWPANYISEAAKLGLMDGVKTSDANRGNVAIIAWNTLTAPYVWDVGETVYNGDISLSNTTRSLLSYHFRDYVYLYDGVGVKDQAALKELRYAEVAQVPATDGTLGKYQIALQITEDTDYDDNLVLNTVFDTKAPRGTDEKEATTRPTNGAIITAYAPTFNNLDSFYGKVVTVIFGEDNELISMRVIDDTVDNEYVTAFKDSKLTIGSNSYKFADDADVYVNTIKMTEGRTAKAAMTVIEGKLGIKFDETYNKVIKSNVVLNNSGKITRLDMFVSGTYPEFLTKEAIVEKVRSEVITLNNDEDIDYGEDGEYEDEDDQPRVIKDGTIIGLEDIVAGDVLTYYYAAANDDTIKTIYVSSNTVEGELTRVSKTDLRMTVEGEKYFYSMGDLENSFPYTDDKISDATAKTDASDYIGENVTLYMNVYGEYVLMASEKSADNWVFGIVTKVYDEEDDTEDDNIFYKKLRVLMADGTTARNYVVVYDTDDNETDANDWDAVDALKDELVVFTADSNSQIDLVDIHQATVANLGNNNNVTNGDYLAVAATEGTAEIDTDRQRIDGKIFSDGKTRIFNTGAEDDASVSGDWDMLIDNTDNLAYNATLIYEEDAKTLSYVLIDVNEDDYTTSDALYAIVVTDDYKENSGSTTKRYVDLLLADKTEAETIEAKNLNTPYAVGLEELFIEYTLSGSKLDSADLLIDVPAFKKLKASAEVTDEIDETDETELAATIKTSKNAAYVATEAGTEASAANKNYTVIADTVVTEAAATEVRLATIAAKNGADHGFVAGNKVVLQAAADAVAAHYTKVGVTASTEGALMVVADDTNPLDTRYYVTVTTANTNRVEADEPAFVVGDYVKPVAAVEALLNVYVASTAENALTVIADTENTVAGATQVRLATIVAVNGAGHGFDVGDIVHLNGTVLITRKANFRVVDSSKLLLNYEDDDTDVDYTFGEVEIDEDVVVYDARDGELVTMTFAELRTALETDELYVIPFANSDADAGTANVLVVVD